MKRCSRCKKLLQVDGFYKDRSTSDGISCRCKICNKETKQTKSYKKYKSIADNIYRKKNLDKIKKYIKQYARDNKKKIIEYKKQWYFENKEKVINRVGIRHRERLKTDINYKLAVYLRCRLKSALKYKKSKKSGSFVSDLGCSIQELRVYLGSKFKSGMSWENHGAWHLDHIIPLAHFDLTDREQFLKACHYTNLQPLWAYDNLKKGSKLQE